MPAESPGERSEPIDIRSLVADIEREARARRRAGDVPEDLERELDALFEAIAPVGATSDSVEAALAQADRSTAFDLAAPTASNIPGGEIVKRGLRRATGWQLDHVARQVQAFAFTIVRAMRLLADRMAELERRLPPTGSPARTPFPDSASTFDLAPWTEAVTAWCAPCEGRVLHTECASGALLVALRAAGVDAYGVDPHDTAAALADAASVEVRTVGALPHLEAVPARALGGLVLSGCTDRFVLGDQLQLATEAARVLAPRGRLVVLGTNPVAWERTADPVHSDLTFGRPLHAETWMHLLSRLDFPAVERRDGPPHARLDAGPDAPPAVAEALARVGQALFPPSTYAILAERGADANGDDGRA